MPYTSHQTILAVSEVLHNGIKFQWNQICPLRTSHGAQLFTFPVSQKNSSSQYANKLHRQRTSNTKDFPSLVKAMYSTAMYRQNGIARLKQTSSSTVLSTCKIFETSPPTGALHSPSSSVCLSLTWQSTQ